MVESLAAGGRILLMIATFAATFLTGSRSRVAANPPERLDRYTSHFDPLGRAFKPLEKSIPGLSITGFIKNGTDFNLHGDRKAYRSPGGELLGGLGLGHRSKG